MAARLQHEPQPTASHVLVVEDCPATSEAIRRTLSRAGLEVTVAATRERALELGGLETFDLIILDLDSPRLNGVELCRALGQEAASRDTPVVFVTGAGAGQTVEADAWRAGAVDVISLPFQVMDFLPRVLGSLRHPMREAAEVLEWTVNR